MALTPNPNVNAPGGYGGDKWGANGGGITPFFGPQTVKQTLSNGQRATNYIYNKNNSTVLDGMSRSAVSGIAVDSTVDNITTQSWTADEQSPGVADSQV